MKKYIKITERNSKDDSIVRYYLFSVDEVEYINVCFDGIEKTKDGKRCYYMDMVMRQCLPMRVCKSTDRDTVEWWFDHFCKWLTDEDAKFEIFNFDVYEDF